MIFFTIAHISGVFAAFRALLLLPFEKKNAESFVGLKSRVVVF